MKNYVLLLVFIVTASVLSGCNTVEGMGRDIEKAGESLQKM